MYEGWMRRSDRSWVRRHLKELVVVRRRAAIEGVVSSTVGVGVGEGRERGERRRMVRITGHRERRIHGFRERKQRKAMRFELWLFLFFFSFLLFPLFNFDEIKKKIVEGGDKKRLALERERERV